MRCLQGLSTTDHNGLVSQFSSVLHIDEGTATFFLESSNWDVGVAINTYLAALGGAGGQASMFEQQVPAPESTFLTDLTACHGIVFPPLADVPMVSRVLVTGTAERE
jgi:hypothetical protein